MVDVGVVEMLVFLALAVFVLYTVIRLAVRHALEEDRHLRRLERANAVQESTPE